MTRGIYKVHSRLAIEYTQLSSRLSLSLGSCRSHYQAVSPELHLSWTYPGDVQGVAQMSSSVALISILVEHPRDRANNPVMNENQWCVWLKTLQILF